ncbi:cytochrome c [Artemisia annua]|uniref:Cytochrome c-553 n=1 Tax=Artemisia annua TaxID=35608 RepID=A0A2U1PU96_ARTAN|nr:cytochrome c [Artemisia annua]
MEILNSLNPESIQETTKKIVRRNPDNVNLLNSPIDPRLSLEIHHEKCVKRLVNMESLIPAMLIFSNPCWSWNGSSQTRATDIRGFEGISAWIEYLWSCCGFVGGLSCTREDTTTVLSISRPFLSLLFLCLALDASCVRRDLCIAVAKSMSHPCECRACRILANAGHVASLRMPFEKGKQLDEAAQQVNSKQELKFVKRLVGPPLLAAFLALSPIITPPVSYGQAIETQRGASLFGRACIGCHDAGGNILQPIKVLTNQPSLLLPIYVFFQGATLFLKDLQRNGVDTEEEIYRITYYGKGRMPGFGELCTPRGQCTFGARLKEDEIKVLADFVKSQADKGWPDIGITGD